MGDQEAGLNGYGLKRQLAESPSRQKKSLIPNKFQLLILLCVIVFVMCLALSDNSLAWWQRFELHKHYNWFFNQTDRGNMVPPYKIQPRQRVVLTTPHKTTEPPTLQPGVIWYHQAYPGNYHFIMDNADVCRNKTPFLVLMVPVAPNNIAARDAIRQTWGKDSMVKGELVLTLFMLGLSHEVDDEKLKQENEQHHDLIQSNFMDTYLNLTIKTMVIMDWLAKRCPTAAYAMKVDSDMFLNIDNLVIMLQKPEIPKMNYLTGLLMWNRPVVRSKNSKWYVPEELYPEPLYPTYTLGMGYIFSNDLPKKFVEVSKAIKPFNIEDAYIGMCIKKLGYAPTSPPDPSQFQSYSKGYNRCQYSKIITFILGSSQDLKNYWEDHKKPGPYC
ncbi:beta-1,3-galactosyltransferase 2 isoform X2 [Austrofundulus limnaeus]|uniref:Hexosyltransferase n=1 Tax=Austrofundulus limnaeus TaxID=52670 RepID=A0A2I4BU83_AUSLI|nr:PREDICTED: beta-1,3-galactosyltransferase 2-like isoform X2 [Austrofundulus limnaeus]